MENKVFDKFIKSSLERIETPYDVDQWQKMEDALDKEEGYTAHDPVDDVARKNIRNIDTEYRPEYWEQMSQRLDDEYSILRRIYKYKVVEAGLVMLVLLTLINFLPTYPRLFHLQLRPANHGQQVIPPAAPATQQDNRVFADAGQSKTSANTSLSAPASTISNNKATASNIANNTTISSNIPNDMTAVAMMADNEMGVSEKSKLSPDVVQDALKANHKVGTIEVTELISSIVDATEAGVKVVEVAATTKTKTAVPTALAAGTQEVITAVPTALAAGTQEVITAVPAALAAGTQEVKPINLLELKDPQLSSDIADGFAPKLSITDPTVSRNIFRMGIATALDLDHVVIPYSEPFENEPPYEQWSSGYSSGITAGLVAKSWEIEAAALYSNKRYSSNKVIQGGDFYTGYYLDSLRNVELSIIKIPVSIHHHILKQGRVKLYALVGAAVNLAITGNYDRDIAPWGNIASGGPTFLKSSVERDGILEGGKFKENFYATADAGIGMEYAITPGLSVYAQGTYQQHLGDLGPNKDKINSLSLYVGVKHNL